MSGDEDRRRARREAKLRALVRDRGGVAAEATAVAFAGGAALVAPGAPTGDLWVLVADDAERGLGRALLLATRQPVGALHLVHEDPAYAPVDARRCAQLVLPAEVFTVAGTALEPVDPSPVASPPDPPSGPEVRTLVDLLVDAGVEVLVESGVVTGEVRGLEVARIRTDDTGQAVLDVGVGRFDQEATALLHADTPTPEALGRAVGLVRELRRPDAAPHPVNRLARERWLRAQVIDRPGLVGLDAVAPISPPEPRRNVKEPAPAAAIGHRPSGDPVLVVCTVGVDVSWLPFAADLVGRERPGEVLVVLPPRDLIPAQERLARLLSVPVGFVPLAGDWPV